MEIKELKFVMPKKVVAIRGSQIKKIFKSLEYNSISVIMKSSWKGLNKLRIVQILFKGLLRKSVGKFGITREMQRKIMPSISKYKDKDIKFVEVVFNDGKSLIFDTTGIYMLDILQDLNDVIYKNQYFVSEENIKNKTVVDCGANKGVFSIFAIFLGAKKVYSFEPVSLSKINLSKSIKLNKMDDKIILFQKALGEKNYFEKISFRYAGDGGGQINHNKLKEKGWFSEDIEVAKLDDLNFKKIDFFKIDTEGFEANVLNGAKETIKKYKPIISLSAYHKPFDKKELPELIKSIRKDYTIKLNKFSEEDLYCY